MNNRIVYILILCIGFWLAPKAGRACTPHTVKAKTCKAIQKAQQRKVSIGHTCCHNDKQLKYADCKHCSGHSCTCSGSVRTGFDTSFTPAYQIGLIRSWWQDRIAVAANDHLYLSKGFYSYWLPPKI